VELRVETELQLLYLSRIPAKLVEDDVLVGTKLHKGPIEEQTVNACNPRLMRGGYCVHHR
jgi:hypothetical protein